jgi:hypothetical protein
MKRFLTLCLMVVSPVGLCVLVWAICGNTTTAHGKERTVLRTAKQATTQTAKQIDGISKLLLVRGKSRAEALRLALGSGAKKVVIALWNVDTKTASSIRVQFETIEYHIVNGRVVETELSISRSRGQKSIKGVYDEVLAAGKTDRTRTTKQKVFLTIPLRNKQILKVEMQPPSGGGMPPWRARFRTGGSVARSVSVSKPIKAAPHPGKGADAGHSKVIAGIRIPVSVSTRQLAAFLQSRWKLLRSIELQNVPIPFGKGKVVWSEELSYAFAPEKGAWAVRAGVLGKLQCRIHEKDQDYKTLIAFVADIRRRGHVTLSKKRFFIANVTMPTTGAKGEVAASLSISDPEYRAFLEKEGRELHGGITITVNPPDKDSDAPATKPAKGKSKK